MEIKVSKETFDGIVLDILESDRWDLQLSLTGRKNGSTIGLFSTNRKKDIKQIKKQIKAFDKVISWYNK